MTKVLFSLDEEDYITPRADESVEFWAKVLKENGIKGSFNLVAERARVLRERGRKDIIELLKFHEINYHSDYHSLHPTFPEYLEELEWDEGVREVIKREIKGLNDVKEIFGQSPIGFMQPGNSGTPQVFYAMFLLDMPVMEASFLHTLSDGKLVWYCNSLNGLTWDFSFESYFFCENRLEAMKNDFQKLCEKHEIVVLGTHPCRLVTSEFWDNVNFSKGQNTPPENYKPAPLYPDHFVQELMRDITAFVKWLKAKADIEFITYREVYDRYRQTTKWVDTDTLFKLAEKMLEKIDYAVLDGQSFSAAEIFSLFVWALKHFAVNNHLPEKIPARRTIGPTSEIPPIEKELEVSLGDFLKGCREANDFIVQKNRLPPYVEIGGVKIGIGSFLKSMAGCLLALKEGIKRANIQIGKAESYPAIAEELPLPNYEGTWLYPPSFKGEKIIKLAKLQFWSIKPA